MKTNKKIIQLLLGIISQLESEITEMRARPPVRTPDGESIRKALHDVSNLIDPGAYQIIYADKDAVAFIHLLGRMASQRTTASQQPTDSPSSPQR